MKCAECSDRWKCGAGYVLRRKRRGCEKAKSQLSDRTQTGSRGGGRMKIEIDDQDFGTVCVCALRYAMGRKTYMPSLVRDFVRPLLPKLSDKTLSVMKADCEFQARYNCYGDEIIDKPDWIKWAEEIEAEIKKRGETT